jgi:hypothetical protein
MSTAAFRRESVRPSLPWRMISAIYGIDRAHLITGGLGNQMFQHAYAMALQSQDGARAVVDASRCGRNRTYVGYEIDQVFTLKGALPLQGWAKSQLLYRTARLCGDIRTDAGDVRFNSAFMRPDQRGYLQGFFPSFRYFSQAEARVRGAFQFKRPLPRKAAEQADMLLHGDSVAVHVRRGDYLVGNHAKAFMGICTASYYQSAIRHLLQLRPQARFYFFSDDPEWCRREFADVAAAVIDGNPRESAWIDMALMARCRHAIVANSSFSWWGRWLGGFDGAICVGPSRLMNDPGNLSAAYDFFQPCYTLIDDAGMIVRPATSHD